MATTMAAKAVCAPTKAACSTRALRAAPLRARAGRRSVQVAAKVQYEYPVKVFEQELVKVGLAARMWGPGGHGIAFQGDWTRECAALGPVQRWHRAWLSCERPARLHRLLPSSSQCGRRRDVAGAAPRSLGGPGCRAAAERRHSRPARRPGRARARLRS